MFTGLRSRQTEEWGEVGSQEAPHSAPKTPEGKAPLRAPPKARLRSDFYRSLISILRMFRLGLL